MKRKIFFKVITAVLGAMLCVAPFTACAKESLQDFNVKVVPATVKYKLDQEIDSYSGSVNISLAKNEYESAQIIVCPEKNITALDVSVSDLIDGENKIASEQIEIYWEHYVYIDKNDIKNSEKTGFTQGFYPDALVPLELRKDAGETMVRAGENQGIWVSVKTSAETPAGIYKGELTLNGDGYTEKVPFSVRVFDFALENANHFMTAFAIWDGMPDDMLFSAYQSSDKQIAENYYEFMLDYRVNPTHIPNVNRLTLAEQTEDFLKNIQREEVGSLALPYTLTGDEIGFDRGDMKHILTALAEAAVKDDSILDKAYAYFTFIDEPTAISYGRVKKVNEAFHDLLVTVADEKLSGAGLESAKEKFLDIECVNTTAYNREKVDAGLVTDGNNVGIDTWCPTFDYFNSEKYRYEMDERLAAGDGVWWYGCVEPRNPFPTFSVNDHLMPQRFVSWMQMEYGIEGQLFWATNAYEQYSYEKLDYVWRDVWKDPVAFPSAPGDGYLTYPGYKYGLNQPIPTIRLDNFRAAQEDYEYLYLLKTLFEKNKPAQIGYDFNTYVGNLYRQLYQGVIARNNSEIFDSVRLELANLIELAEKGIFVDFSVNTINNNCVVNVYSKSKLTDVSLSDAAMKENTLSGGFKYSGNFIITGGDEYASIRCTAGGQALAIDRFTGGSNKFYAAFDGTDAMDSVSVSKCNRLGNDDVKAEIVDRAVNGSSMKVTYEVPDKPTLGYLPTVTVKNSAYIDFSRGEVFRIDIYNESSRNVEISVMLTDSSGKSETFYKAYLMPQKWNHVEILAYNADIARLDLANITEIKFVAESLVSEADNMVLYYDNVVLSSRGAV